jgi:hypothetical protein
MPKMVLKQESRLNGVKTNIFNLGDIAKSLRVSEEGMLNMLVQLGPNFVKFSDNQVLVR